MEINDHGNIGRQVSRRNVLRVMAGSGAAMMAGGATTSGRERTAGAGRIRQSIAYWCVQKYWSVEETCRIARELGCQSVELVEPKDWPIMEEIARTGYTGYVGHEFIPTRDPREGLQQAVTLCDI